MFRGLFLATGISLCIIGAEAFLVEKVMLRPRETATQFSYEDPLAAYNNSTYPYTYTAYNTPLQPAGPREFQFPDWAPWGGLSVGAVIILWTLTLPRRRD